MATGYAVQDRLAKTTRGEQLVYGWLCDALPDDFDVWHEPRVAGSKPDLVVFGPDLGLLVLEVKDWSADAIVGVDAGRSVHLRDVKNVKTATHPVEQAEQHLFRIKEMLDRELSCVHASGVHRGRLQFPFAKGAVFPNLTVRDVEELDLCTGYASGAVVAGDELGTPPSWALRGRALIDRLRLAFGVGFAWTVTEAMRAAVCGVLFPETTVRRTYAGRVLKHAAAGAQQGSLPMMSTRPMSEEQRRVALQLSGGHQVLQGVAGSGKSEVVAARARILADANPAWRILVLCFNVSLAAWLRSRVFEGGELQRHALTVLHFHEWARDLLDRAGIGYARRIYEEQDAFPQLLLDALRDGRITQRYDAVIVDEGQDFSVPMLQACLAALKPERETFLLALDNAQKIYEGSDVSLSSAGVQARGKATFLKVNHRCSREINTFSRRLLWGDVEEGATIRVGDQSAIVPISSDRSGPPVEVRRCADVLEQATWAAERCQELASQGWTPDEMAVLYASSHVSALGAPVARDAAEAIDLVALLQEAFREAQVPLHWLSRDRGTKADAVLDHGGVALSTVHSFKGLESRVVVLFGMDRPRAGAGTRPQGKALLYVGMTRATHRLLVPWSNPEGFGAEAESLGG
jgi:hypothetical protein